MKEEERDYTSMSDIKTQFWNGQNTQLLINLYIERKDKFRNPEFKKKQLWSEICREMKAGGYDIDAETADRKWRNLKKTYSNIKFNNTGRTSWAYYKILETIFGDDAVWNYNHSKTSYSPPSPKRERKAPAMKSSPSRAKASMPAFSFVNAPDDESENMLELTEDEEEPLRNSTVKLNRGGKRINHTFKRKALLMEERRTNSIGVLAKAIDESNRIQEDRNALMREFIDKLFPNK